MIHYYPLLMLFLVLDMANLSSCFQSPFFTPSWVGSYPSLRSCRGRCKFGQIETLPLTHDRQLVGARVSKNGDLAVFLGSLAYFWSVQWVKGRHHV